MIETSSSVSPTEPSVFTSSVGMACGGRGVRPLTLLCAEPVPLLKSRITYSSSRT